MVVMMMIVIMMCIYILITTTTTTTTASSLLSLKVNPGVVVVGEVGLGKFIMYCDVVY